MAACSSCSRELPGEFPFCPFCGAALVVEAPVREERKVVTVVFCDLVGSTARAERLDPEDVRALLSNYHSRVREQLERFGGTVLTKDVRGFAGGHVVVGLARGRVPRLIGRSRGISGTRRAS